jgi:hypothetical protein
MVAMYSAGGAIAGDRDQISAIDVQSGSRSGMEPGKLSVCGRRGLRWGGSDKRRSNHRRHNRALPAERLSRLMVELRGLQGQ